MGTEKHIINSSIVHRRTLYFSIISSSFHRKGKKYWLLHAPIILL